MLGSTLAARGVDHIKSRAATDTTAKMLRRMLPGEWNVRCVCQCSLRCSYSPYCTLPTDVKMDWCNTKINGTQLDPKEQYPQMVKLLHKHAD